MAFAFECSHGCVSERSPEPLVSHDQILDIQLKLYEEMLGYALENRLPWTLPHAAHEKKRQLMARNDNSAAAAQAGRSP